MKTNVLRVPGRRTHASRLAADYEMHHGDGTGYD